MNNKSMAVFANWLITTEVNGWWVGLSLASYYY